MSDIKFGLGFWEKPRTIAVLLIVVAAISGYLGFDFGRQVAQQQQRAAWVIQLPPGTVPRVVAQ